MIALHLAVSGGHDSLVSLLLDHDRKLRESESADENHEKTTEGTGGKIEETTGNTGERREEATKSVGARGGYWKRSTTTDELRSSL